MPEVTAHAPGTVAWMELATPSVDASRTFYREVFGWYSYTLTVSPLGDYEIFTLGGVQGPEVTGAQPLADESQPGSWTCYFRTDDPPATLDAVRAAGGLVAAEPTDVGDLGRGALCSDSQGADFGLWLPYNLKGAGVIDEPNAMCWVELACPDVQDARRFYGSVFGWTPVDRTYYAPDYTNWKLGGRSVAGLVPIEEWWPRSFPPHWTPYFWVSDCDATTSRAADLGAHVYVQPVDIGPGRFSVLTDPTGARLALITPSSRSTAPHQLT
ncbi:VOC family protein [Actinomadura chibensis]|uniref:VOC family protein n=1 Tax=Actinomadura chibensis TaxID=392828 RepID=A0A5D0NRQ6_9ACTN|nr:VOC family protein [Actinomadura chibensis]TYB46818.1 VOC family protein [Actinomadura chibensis]